MKTRMLQGKRFELKTEKTRYVMYEYPKDNQLCVFQKMNDFFPWNTVNDFLCSRE